MDCIVHGVTESDKTEQLSQVVIIAAGLCLLIFLTHYCELMHVPCGAHCQLLIFINIKSSESLDRRMDRSKSFFCHIHV